MDRIYRLMPFGYGKGIFRGNQNFAKQKVFG